MTMVSQYSQPSIKSMRNSGLSRWSISISEMTCTSIFSSASFCFPSQTKDARQQITSMSSSVTRSMICTLLLCLLSFYGSLKNQKNFLISGKVFLFSENLLEKNLWNKYSADTYFKQKNYEKTPPQYEKRFQRNTLCLCRHQYKNYYSGGCDF